MSSHNSAEFGGAHTLAPDESLAIGLARVTEYVESKGFNPPIVVGFPVTGLLSQVVESQFIREQHGAGGPQTVPKAFPELTSTMPDSYTAVLSAPPDFGDIRTARIMQKGRIDSDRLRSVAEKTRLPGAVAAADRLFLPGRRLFTAGEVPNLLLVGDKYGDGRGRVQEAIDKFGLKGAVRIINKLGCLSVENGVAQLKFQSASPETLDVDDDLRPMIVRFPGVGTDQRRYHIATFLPSFQANLVHLNYMTSSVPGTIANFTSGRFLIESPQVQSMSWQMAQVVHDSRSRTRLRSGTIDSRSLTVIRSSAHKQVQPPLQKLGEALEATGKKFAGFYRSIDDSAGKKQPRITRRARDAVATHHYTFDDLRNKQPKTTEALSKRMRARLRVAGPQLGHRNSLPPHRHFEAIARPIEKYGRGKHKTAK